MASGWLAAVTVNTALADPAGRGSAFAYFAARETDTYAQFLALTRQHLRDGAPGDHPFWADRGAGLPAAPDDDRAEVERAFDRNPRRRRRWPVRVARRRPDRASSGVDRTGDRARAAARDAPTPADGVRFVHGVDVVALAELAPGVPPGVGDLLEADTAPGRHRVTCRRSSQPWPPRWRAAGSLIGGESVLQLSPSTHGNDCPYLHSSVSLALGDWRSLSASASAAQAPAPPQPAAAAAAAPAKPEVGIPVTDHDGA